MKLLSDTYYDMESFVDLPPDARETLLLFSERQIARRAIPAAFIYVALLVAAALTTRLGETNPVMCWIFFVLFSLTGTVRFVLALRFDQLRLKHSRVWALVEPICFIFSGMLWSFLCCYSILANKLSFETLFFLVLTAGLSSGSILVYSPRLAVNHLYMVCLMCPVGAVSLLVDPPRGYSIGISTFAFLLILAFEASIIHRQYWESLVNGKLAELQAVQLEAEKARAEEYARAKSQFLANMSHEIRTPITGIMGMTELSLDMKPAPEMRRCLETVLASAESLLSIINDILDYSKVEAGKMALEPIPFEIRKMLGNMLKSIAVKASEKGLTLAFGVAPSVPETLCGDPFRLRQVLVNVVGNAIKFTEAGEITVSVDGDRTQTGFELHLVVADTGIGIPENKRQTVFEPFSQSDCSMTRRFGGTGLGLSITKAIVELMGGSIWVESPSTRRPAEDAGPGCDFHLKLPFQVVESAPALEADAGLRLQGMRILVAETHPLNRQYLRDLLAKEAAAVETVNSLPALQEALLQVRGVTLVILDADMRLQGEEDFTFRLRKRMAPAKVPILLLAESGNRVHLTRCLEGGVSASLIKPFTPAELIESVEHTIRIAMGIVDPLGTNPGLAGKPWRQLRILLAEDNEITTTTLSMMLQRAGHVVDCVASGAGAVRKAAEADYDVLLMDVQMPGMDGLTATRLIREAERPGGPRLPIVALTAHAQKSDEARCLEAGMDQFLSKPLHARDLFAMLERLTGAAGVPPPKAGVPPLPEKKAEAASPPVDIETVLESLAGSTDILAKLAARFSLQVPDRLTALKAAIEAARFDEVTHEAHKLKGVAGYFSATASRLGAELETAARKADAARVATVGADFLAAVKSILDHLASKDWASALNSRKA